MAGGCCAGADAGPSAGPSAAPSTGAILAPSSKAPATPSLIPSPTSPETSAPAFVARYSGWVDRHEAIATAVRAVETYRFTHYVYPVLGS